jgi:ATP-dependent DNA ligase
VDCEVFIRGELDSFLQSCERVAFSRLQNFSKYAQLITFFVFDLLFWKGEDLRPQPLENRRELLRSRVMPTVPAIRYSESSPSRPRKW